MGLLSSPAELAFVGREREMDLLRSELEAACTDGGGIVLLVGEPGIGKTRTAEELAAIAQFRGARVLWGRCWEGEGTPAFWPWVQLIRDYVRDRDPRVLPSELGLGASVIAQLMPEVHEHLPGLSPAPPLEPARARFRLFESVTCFLKNVAQTQPLVLILDDLHWADVSSLLLLRFFALDLRGARVFILGLYRDAEVSRQHPLAQTLAELDRERHVQRVFLQGLSERDVTHVIELAAGVAPNKQLVAAIHDKTEGNPFFVREILRLLAAEGSLASPDVGSAGSIPIPRSVREVVESRLACLSVECHRVLAIAAVVGHESSFRVIELVSGLAGDTLLEVLEEAETARLITQVRGIPGRYQFAHTLIRETLYETLPTTRRVRLHRQVGEVLERLHDGSHDLPLAEIAHHFFQSIPGGDADKALDYSRRAGDRALTLLAYEEAAGHYERALQMLDLRVPIDESQRGALHLALGEAQRKAGDLHQAMATFQRVAVAARIVGAAEQLAYAALGFEDALLQTGLPRSGTDDPSVLLLDEALRALGGEENVLRAKLLAGLARALYFAGQRERAAVLSAEAVEMARRVGDPATLAYTLNARRIAIWGPERLEERLAVATELIQHAEAVGDRELALEGRERRLVALLEQGDIPMLDEEISTYARKAAALRQPHYLWYAATWRAERALLDGRFAEAEQLIQQALAFGERAQNQEAIVFYTVQMVWLRREQGRLHELESAVKHMAYQYPHVPALRCILANVLSGLGRTSEAREEFDTLAANDFADLPLNGLWLVSLAYLTEVCVSLGDDRRAAVLYELLHPYAGQCIAAIECFGSTARYLGLLAAMLRRWDEAQEHFETALRLNERMGARPWLARTQQAYGAMLLARGRRADLSRVNELLTSALSIYTDLGLEHDAAKVRALLADPRLAVAPVRAPAYPDRLTVREVEVLRLVADGRSNREIANELVLSVRTVERHLENIYAKIGAANRREARHYALGRGFVSPTRDSPV